MGEDPEAVFPDGGEGVLGDLFGGIPAAMTGSRLGPGEEPAMAVATAAGQRTETPMTARWRRRRGCADHLGDEGADAVHDTVEVYFQEVFPFGGGGFPDGLATGGDSGVATEDADGAEAGLRGFGAKLSWRTPGWPPARRPGLAWFRVRGGACRIGSPDRKLSGSGRGISSAHSLSPPRGRHHIRPRR